VGAAKRVAGASAKMRVIVLKIIVISGNEVLVCCGGG
jgi:hypothetical protein